MATNLRLIEVGCAPFATEERFEQFDRLPMQMPSEERKMRLTSRDEGGGRGGGGKEEKGGVDELHFYLGLGMSWNINCLDCERVGGRVARKNTAKNKSRASSHPGSPRGGGAICGGKTTRQSTFLYWGETKRGKGELRISRASRTKRTIFITIV